MKVFEDLNSFSFLILFILRKYTEITVSQSRNFTRHFKYQTIYMYQYIVFMYISYTCE